MLTRLLLAVIGWLGHRLGRAVRKSAMRPQSLATLNPDLLRQMPPRTRKRWRVFRVLRPLCLPLLLLTGCDPLARTFGDVAAHVAACWALLVLGGGATLIGRGIKVRFGWSTAFAALGSAAWWLVRWLAPMALLLLLSSPALAQTAAQELAPVSVPNHGGWEPVTAGLNRQDREMVGGGPDVGQPPPACEESLQDRRRLAMELHQEQPARWPWALGGLLVGALLFVPLGAWGLLRSGRGKVVLMQRVDLHDFEWYVHHAAGKWWVTDDSQNIAHYFRFWWQALRDAWRLSREVR